MKVIGIDLSLTSTGVAAYHQDGTAVTDVITSVGKRADPLWSRAKRLRYLADEVDNWVLPLDGTSLVVVEGPAYGVRGASTWDRAGLWWWVVGRLHFHGVGVASVSPTTLKRWATGSGAADKAAVAAAVARRTTAELASSDAADALALAMMGAHWLRWIDGPKYADVALGAVEWPEVAW